MSSYDQEGLTGVQAALAAGRQLATAEERILESAEDGIPLKLDAAGNVAVFTDLLGLRDARAPLPRRLQGTATADELDSFCALVNRFKDGNSAVFANIKDTKLTAVLDYHCARTEDKPGMELQRWAQHRVVYQCPQSQQWKTWTGNAGKQMSQEAFADFIEQNAVDMVGPKDTADKEQYAMPARLIEMARYLSIKTTGEFTRTVNPTTGEFTLVNKEEQDRTTSTKIAKGFLLGIPVFEAGDSYRVEALIRFAMPSGRPVFSYVLVAPDRVLRDAFNKVREVVEQATSLPLYAGSPQ